MTEVNDAHTEFSSVPVKEGPRNGSRRRALDLPLVRFARWLIRRLLIMALQLVLVSVAIFGALFLTPGKPEQILLGGHRATAESLAAIRTKYHLDDSLPEQYWIWLKHAVHFDFGRSVQTGQTVTSVIGDRLSVTLFLGAYALIIVLIIAIPLGLIAGVRSGSRIDKLITIATTIGISAPAFAVGIVALYLFGVVLGWFPVYGAGSGFGSMFWHLTLPAGTLALSVVAIVTRQTRAAAMKTYDQDFMTFARVRGLSRKTLWSRYLLRNSSLPVATSIGLVSAYFLTGAVIVEQTFALSGIGSLILESISTKDVPVVQGVGLLAAIFVLVANLLAELSYAILDPRLRKQVFA